MTLGIIDASRNVLMDDLATKVDAGAGPGLLRIYDGARPAKGGAVTTLLATLTFSDPAFGAAVAGVLTANALTGDSAADAAGTGTWFRIVDSTGAFVCDGSVGLSASGEDLELNTVTFSIGLIVSITSCILTAGNA